MASSASADAPSLLLLASPPDPATPDALRAAYRRPLAAVISRLSHENRPNTPRDVAPVLVVAVASPVLAKSDAAPARETHGRSVDWSRSQSLLAGLYALVAVICAERSIATDLAADDPGAVDVRLLLIDHDQSSASDYRPGPNGSYEPNNTTVLDLAAFATLVRPWRCIFHPSSEAGHRLHAAYLKYASGKQRFLQSQLVAVDGGLTLSQQIANDEASARQRKRPAKSYTSVCLGGTFDHLHPGHKLFLHAAVLLLNLEEESSAEKPRCELVIGISSDELLAKKKYADQLQSWDVRARFVINFLATLLNWCTTSTTDTKAVQAETKELHATFRNGAILVRCVDFHDLYGPTVKQQSIQALVVSGETRSGGQAVNDKRHSQGWPILDIYEIDVLDAGIDSVEGGGSGNGNGNATSSANFESKISSTEIRKQKAQRLASSRVEPSEDVKP
ncbi:pantetheine-phosphate adenylyltransferase family protein [Metarhizium album ARSEF 1941]|uniref:Pantetheine-phosphate adenylyltransferase family protein n=1 Tax=Metarhizium album (strain ARSEF 1941) TaxID=1081103 RepID=A0A0B2WR62_METAS|nr:pantetheine-phosphate adenylyltransferase family protein [Metarhizium album ARSEF 1941]KHN95465.1 pantetheine-phosphate adenylyltransferase family protein [Metarhizium album ARSEF 1941]